MPHKNRETRLAYLRSWKEKHRPRPQPVEQADKTLPPRGKMQFSADGAMVQCHSCGTWLGNLNSHMRTHGLDARSYKELYDLPRTISLLPPVTAEKQRQAALDRDQGSIGRQHIPPAKGRAAGQDARLGVRIEASEQRQGVYTRGGNKTK